MMYNLAYLNKLVKAMYGLAGIFIWEGTGDQSVFSSF